MGCTFHPNAPSDDSITMLAKPGQMLHYQVHIPPNHPTGLFWYHSHAHGEAERQNLAGMSGALIVDGIVAHVPQVATMPERVLLVRDALPPGQALPNGNADQLRAFNATGHGMQMGPLGAPGPRKRAATAPTARRDALHGRRPELQPLPPLGGSGHALQRNGNCREVLDGERTDAPVDCDPARRKTVLAPGQRGLRHVPRRAGRQHADADRRARRRSARHRRRKLRRP